MKESMQAAFLQTFAQARCGRVNLPGGGLARVRYARIATKFRSAPK